MHLIETFGRALNSHDCDSLFYLFRI